MAKITNTGKQPRAFFRPSNNELVELAKDQSAEVSADDLAKLKKNPAFAASLEIEGEEDAGEEPKAPAKKRGRKPKAEKADGEADNDEDEGDNPDAAGGE